MKKPNITEGEWEFHHEGHKLSVRTSKWGVFLHPIDIDDAKAISAVPEMIDALIDQYNSWLNVKNNCKDKELAEYAEAKLLQLQQALKKAGVEL